VLNTITTIIGAIEASEALKILLGTKIEPQILYYDVWEHSFRLIKADRREGCECCVKREFEFLRVGSGNIVRELCGVNAVQIIPVRQHKLALSGLATKLQRLGATKLEDIFLEFKTEKYCLKIFWNGRTVVYGTNDKKIAKSLYAKYVGV
jgi:adenylyltransferase/sulfurtransferase